MDPQDPFLQVQSDVLDLLNSTRPLLSSYHRIRSTSSSTNPELLDTRSELLTALDDLEADLEDLRASVRAVEGDPYKYGLEVEEVERRRRLVRDVGREVEGMRRAVGEGDGKPQSGAGLPDPDAFDSDEEMGGDGDAYVAMEQQRQQEMLEEQDEALDGVFRTVGNLRQQADDMGRELEEQGELLDGVDEIADRVGGKLQTGIKKIGWVIKKNEGEFTGL